MKAAHSAFESSLDEIGVSVERTDLASLQDRIDELISPQAVGVSLEETFDDPAFSLAKMAATVDPTPVALREATTEVTGVRLGVADYGSLVLRPTARADELVSLFVDRHMAVIREADIVRDMDATIDAIDAIDGEIDRTGGSAILATGPSATADMGALVDGAHGPREVYVLVVEKEG